MKTFICIFLFLTSFGFAEEDLKFFEDRYGVKIEGVKPLSEYDDPDSFYSAISAKLKIPSVAFKAAEKQFGWKKDKTMAQKAIVRRRGGQWILMMFQIKIDPEKKKPDMKTMETKWVVIDDKKKVIYSGDKQPTKKIVEQGSESDS